MTETSDTSLSSPVTIREMKIEDLAAVFHLGEKLFTADRWPNLYRTWDEYEVVGIFSSDGDTCLVAEQDDEVVGFALGTIIDKRNSAWVYGYLLWLGVDPDIKGTGVGKRLVDRLTHLLIGFGARMMLTDTDGDNKHAIRFFERQGFGNPQHHVYMTRNLTHHPAYLERQDSHSAQSTTEERPPHHDAKHHVPGGPPSMSLPQSAADKPAADKPSSLESSDDDDD